jgi:hypothetical protein
LLSKATRCILALRKPIGLRFADHDTKDLAAPMQDSKKKTLSLLAWLQSWGLGAAGTAFPGTNRSAPSSGALHQGCGACRNLAGQMLRWVIGARQDCQLRQARRARCATFPYSGGANSCCRLTIGKRGCTCCGKESSHGCAFLYGNVAILDLGCGDFVTMWVKVLSRALSQH